MKTDIPQLMQERQLDAVIVYGNTGASSDLAYVLGGAKLERALLAWKQDSEPVLFASVLEREVAQNTGYTVRLWTDFPLQRYLQATEGDRFAALVAQWSDLLQDLDISGRVGFYGSLDLGFSYRFLSALAQANPGLEIVGEMTPNLFSAARQRKDATELALMQDVARRTTAVIDATIAFVQRHRVDGEHLRKDDGSPLTIGDVKAHIRLELAKRNLEAPHPTIFSQGRDAGVPHNSGRPDMALQLGQPIIFDIFPCDAASGYFHDITRTFFLGYAPDDLAQRWQHVKQAFDAAMEALAVGRPCRDYQALVCDIFEDMGYPTSRSAPGTLVGYNHSLGHGLGLDVHEAPSLSLMPGNDTVLQPGHVFTIEPGLYYPDEGWGIRIEDTVAFDAAGNLLNLSSYPYTMVISLD